MEGGRANHSCYMGEVGHSCGGLGEAEMEVVVGNHAEEARRGWSHVWR